MTSPATLGTDRPDASAVSNTVSPLGFTSTSLLLLLALTSNSVVVEKTVPLFVKSLSVSA